MAIVTAAQVIRSFEEEFGRTLARFPADPSFYPDADCEWLAFADDDVDELDRELGAFEVYVFRSPDEHVTVVNDDGTSLEEDDTQQGVLWFRDDDPAGGTWIAFTNYPENLQLVWYAGRERTLGSRWERLDGVMTRIAAARTPPER